jgi:hypothetical protein
LWIALVAALILLLSVGGLAYFLVLPAIQQASPDGTLQTYCDASKKMDAHELVSTFSTSLKARPQNGEADFGFTFGILKFEGILATGCTVSNVQQHGSTATATVTISYQLPQNKTDSTVQTVSLIVENGVWKVNNYTVRNR